MMKNGKDSTRDLTQQQRKNMIFLFEVSKVRRKMTESVEKSMHEHYDHIVQQVEHPCVYCLEKFNGKSIGAHYRNSDKCKYMKDRPWLKVLPANWRQDLQRFLEKENDD